MYRKLLATTALSLVLAGGAYAQDAAQPAPADPMTEAPAAEAPADPLVTAQEQGISANGWLASEIIGSTIYNSTADDAESIGEVNDFVLDQNGEIGAVIVGVGGFLGIGQKDVAVNWDDLELVVGADGEQRLVANMTREQLEAAPEFDRAEWLASESANNQNMDQGAAPMDGAAPMAPAAPADQQLPADQSQTDPAANAEPADPNVPGNELNEGEAATGDQMATEGQADQQATGDQMATEGQADQQATGDQMVTEGQAGVQQPAGDQVATGTTEWSTYQAVEVSEISAEELNGTTVYGAGDEDIGAIGDVILSDSGEVDAVIIDFGGFLGIGTKPVAVSFENLTFLRDGDGNLVLRTNLTREQLEAAPEYNEEAYLASPDENRVVVQQ